MTAETLGSLWMLVDQPEEKTTVEVVAVTVLDPVTAEDAATQGQEAGIGALEAGAVTEGVTVQDPVTAMTVVIGQDLDPETADDQGPRIVAAVAATKAAARNCEDYIQQNLIYCFGTIIQL